jgi:hypothetical protein
MLLLGGVEFFEEGVSHGGALAGVKLLRIISGESSVRPRDAHSDTILYHETDTQPHELRSFHVATDHRRLILIGVDQSPFCGLPIHFYFEDASFFGSEPHFGRLDSREYSLHRCFLQKAEQGGGLQLRAAALF